MALQNLQLRCRPKVLRLTEKPLVKTRNISNAADITSEVKVDVKSPCYKTEIA